MRLNNRRIEYIHKDHQVSHGHLLGAGQIGGVFLQEFKEGRRGLATAPQVLFTTKNPPQELQGTDAASGENVGYVTFVLLPRHFSPKTPQTREKNYRFDSHVPKLSPLPHQMFKSLYQFTYAR